MFAIYRLFQLKKVGSGQEGTLLFPGGSQAPTMEPVSFLNGLLCAQRDAHSCRKERALSASLGV